MSTHKKAQVGLINNYSVANPGAGLGFVVQPPVGEQWLLHSVTFLFTTSAAVANRGVFWTLYDGTQDLGICFTNFIHAASIAVTYSLVRKSVNVARQGFGRVEDGLPDDCWINQGFYLRVSVDNIDVADAITNIRGRCEEWIDN